MNNETIAWICLNDDEITESKSLADNWVHHGYDVKPLTDSELCKYKEALAVQTVYEASIPSLTPDHMSNIEAAMKNLVITRKLPLTFCDPTSSFVVNKE